MQKVLKVFGARKAEVEAKRRDVFSSLLRCAPSSVRKCDRPGNPPPPPHRPLRMLAVAVPGEKRRPLPGVSAPCWGQEERGGAEREKQNHLLLLPKYPTAICLRCWRARRTCWRRRGSARRWAVTRCVGGRVHETRHPTSRSRFLLVDGGVRGVAPSLSTTPPTRVSRRVVAHTPTRGRGEQTTSHDVERRGGIERVLRLFISPARPPPLRARPCAHEPLTKFARTHSF